MRREASEYQRRPVECFLVTTGTPEHTSEFCREHRAPFRCLVDRPGEPTYRDYGLQKVGIVRLFGPNPFVSIATLIKRRREVKVPKSGDVHQLSGTFVIDGAGIVRLAHRDAHPGDHASSADIWACLDAIGAPPV